MKVGEITATVAGQRLSNSNRRNVIHVNDCGESITLKEACRRRGLPYRPVHKRLERGWSVERALSTPVGDIHAAAN